MSRCWLAKAHSPSEPLTFTIASDKSKTTVTPGGTLPGGGVIKYGRFLSLDPDFPKGRYRSVVDYTGKEESASWNDQAEIAVVDPGEPTPPVVDGKDGVTYVVRDGRTVMVSEGYQNTPNIPGTKSLSHHLKKISGASVLPVEVIFFVVPDTVRTKLARALGLLPAPVPPELP